MLRRPGHPPQERSWKAELGDRSNKEVGGQLWTEATSGLPLVGSRLELFLHIKATEEFLKITA